MQFRGALRSPGDRGPGVRVVLVVDEFHLEILRGHDLIGRWYLADVEVVRDIAERFVLFLGDEEMEFLADDALQFAYDGVTAMQNAWLRAQKKKRRHRRAAADAARRKDESPAPASKEKEPKPEPAQQRAARHTRPAATSELARRLAASAPAAPPKARGPDPDQWVGPETEAAPEPEPQPANNGRQSLAARRKKITADAVEPVETPAEPARPQRRRREPASAATAAPPWIAPEPSSEEPVVATGEPVQQPTVADERDVMAPEKVRPSRRRRDSVAAESSEPVRARGRGRRLSADSNGGSSPTVEVVPTSEPEVDEAGEADVRFAAEGHHPAETNTGLLSRLRRQPKLPNDHVHKFQESGSSVGLVRRVCIECSYVSIGSDDDSSSITRW